MAGIYMVELNAEPFWIFDTTISWSFLDYIDPNQLPAEYARGDDVNTYDFPSPTGDFYYYYESVSALTTEQRTWIQHLFTEIESFTKLTFDDTETANNAGEMKFGNASLLLNAPVIVDGNTADATVNGVTPGLGIVRESYDPNDARLGAVWLRQGMSTAQFREIAVHEVCHALGLAHPTGDLTGVPMPADQQTIRFSAMGGTAFIENGAAVPIWAEKSFGFQLYDIAALQAFYDENRDIKTDDTYGIDKVLVTVDEHEWKNQYCIWDGGGIDTLSAAKAEGQGILDLREGRFSSIHNDGNTVEQPTDNISIAFGVEIEDAKGSDTRDLIIGNHLNNMLDAGDGHDVVFGAGNVVHPLNATQDDVQDHELLQARNDAALDYQYSVSDEGKDSGNDLIFGKGGDDHLWGGEGTDIILGGNDADTLHGEDDSVPFSVHSPDDESDILDGGDGADNFHVGEGDIIANLESGDKIYYKGNLLSGGKDYFTFLTGDHQAEYDHELPFEFVGQHGEAYGFFSYGESGVGLAILLPNTTRPVLIYGIDYEIEEDPLRFDVEGDSGWLAGKKIQVEGGSLIFEDWAPIDTNGTNESEESAQVPSFAKNAYDHQRDAYDGESYFTRFIEGGQPGSTSESEAGRIRLEALGYDFEGNSWTEDTLIQKWRPTVQAPDSNSGDQGHLSNPDGTNSADANGNPSAPGETIVAVAAAIGAASSLNTPLVLDLDGDGIELSTLAQSKAYFDLDANGFAQRTGWVTGGDGLLAIDANANGNIDNVNELFGSTDPYGKATTDGFDALSALDSNTDGKIDSSDAKFSDLRVWIDADEDGYTDKGELKTLAEAGIETISLSTTPSGAMIAGNLISDTATYTKSGGGTGTIGDAWFANSTLETVDVGSATISPAVMLMPAMRGYGAVGGLRLEMDRNPDLFTAVSELVLYPQRNDGALPPNVLNSISNIILHWTHAWNAEPRGDYIDPYVLLAMETLTGTPFFQTTGPEGPNPGPNAAAVLVGAWGDLVIAVGTRILVQSIFAPAFPSVSYEWATDSFGGTLDSAAAVAGLAAIVPAGAGVDAYAFWKLAISALDEIAEDLDIDSSEYDTALAAALSNAGFDISLTELRETMVGFGGATSSEDLIVIGTDGFDTLKSGSGDDRVIGGGGNDSLNGQAGSDTYVIGKDSGHDLITDVESGGSSIDTLLFAAGIVPGDALISRNGNDLVVRLAGSDAEVVIEGQFADSDYGVERIKFADGASWTRAFIETLPVLGTAGADTLGGTDNNDFLDGSAGADEMTGGKGSDTYKVDDQGDIVIEAVGEGADLVESSISYVLGANVEGLVLTEGNIDGTGNALDNFLIGSDGDNVLDGGAGADLLAGHQGSDTYVVDDTADKVIEDAYDVGYDTVLSSATWTMSADVEELVLTGTLNVDGTGNDLVNKLTGNGGNNALSGGGGNDMLDGGVGQDTLDGGDDDDNLDGGNGADKMSGGAGDDTYWVDDVGDEAIEEAKKGLDIVYASVSFTLSANVDDLVLTDTAVSGTGNALNNKIVGSNEANVLDGAGGNDQLLGGLGNDTMQGGDGNDDVRGEDGDDVLEGGTGNDSLLGDDGHDWLDGGAGIDFLDGGSGNDTYTVDDSGDLAVEGSGQGTDLVLSSATYVLGNNFERLTLIGTTDVSGTGNTLANVLTGNSGANTLDGANGNDTLNGADGNDSLLGGAGNDSLDGGAGADTMAGGVGNDTYVVDDAADVVVEAAGEGTDVVQSSAANYTLSGNIETLVLAGTSNINGTGSSGVNAITGNVGDNVLDGAGGNDTLEGGDGNDTYLFGYGSGQDHVKDTVGGATPVDILSLMAGVDPEDVNVSKSGTSLFIRLAGSNDRVEIVNYFSGGGAGIDKIQFDGGTSWDRSFIDSLFITGTSSADTLNGTANNDWISGGAGNDQMKGGAGSDTYVVDATKDQVTENANEGYDVIESSVAITLADNVEGLILTANVSGTGNALDNRIIGSSGNNTLNGGAGNDLLIGGGGTDTYFVDSTGDQIIEHAGEGTDSVQSSVDYTLSDNVENLTLSGGTSGTGNSLANTIVGNAGANTLTGFDGDDALDGGAGIDTLIGGLGNDTYSVDNADDVATEADGEGIDLIKASVDGTLGAYIENLTLLGSSGLIGTGNALDNAITGSNGANQLFGDAGNDTLSGGAGVDTMTGGTGNDVYVVDGTTEQVIENADEGTDLVESSAATYTLADNVENLKLTGGSNLIGNGNALANIVTGNSGANQLNGGDGNDTLDGGSKADTLSGGLGDDVYTVDNTNDQVIESASEGIDHVNSSANFTLGANVENLTLIDSGFISGTGNDLDNVITGNFGANTLQGGLGNDVLRGEGNNDTLVGQGGIDTLLGGNNNDTLTWDSEDTLIGDGGRDTLLYNASGTLDIDTAKASNIEVVNLGVGDDNDNGIALSLADVLDLASTASGSGLSANGDALDLLIYGDNASPTADNVDLSGGWTAAGTFTTSALTGSSMTFDVYQASGTQIAVQQGLDLTIV